MEKWREFERCREVEWWIGERCTEGEWWSGGEVKRDWTVERWSELERLRGGKRLRGG